MPGQRSTLRHCWWISDPVHCAIAACVFAVLAFRDTVLAAETCEELFTPQAPHIDLALAGEEALQQTSMLLPLLRQRAQRKRRQKQLQRPSAPRLELCGMPYSGGQQTIEAPSPGAPHRPRAGRWGLASTGCASCNSRAAEAYATSTSVACHSML